jgi:glycosyltransferase involved in cell wall biosynthesis
VIGDGPERKRLERIAGPSVRFLGRCPDPVVRHALARGTALVLPGAEDFGLTPVEAMASGRPVVAFAAGGALETVSNGETGFLFLKQDVEALAAAMLQVLSFRFDARTIRSAADRFGMTTFASRFAALVASSRDVRPAAGAVGL